MAVKLVDASLIGKTILHLVGIGRPGLHSTSLLPTSKEEFEMQVSDKDISVFVDECASEKCSQAEACDKVQCKLCQHCLSSDHDEFFYRTLLFISSHPHTNPSTGTERQRSVQWHI